MLQLLYKIFLRIKHPSCTLNYSAIAKDVVFENNVTMEYGSVVCAKHIGKYTYINKFSLIDKPVKSIGRFCSIAYNVKIGLGNHPSSWVSSHPFAYMKKYGFVNQNLSFEEGIEEDTIIGNDVWIGANATILAGVKIGNGAIIGANSLVNKDVEPYSIVIGTPAKHLKYRFESNVINEIEKLAWWDWDDKKIKKHIHLFSSPQELIKTKG